MGEGVVGGVGGGGEKQSLMKFGRAKVAKDLGVLPRNFGTLRLILITKTDIHYM